MRVFVAAFIATFAVAPPAAAQTGNEGLNRALENLRRAQQQKAQPQTAPKRPSGTAAAGGSPGSPYPQKGVAAPSVSRTEPLDLLGVQLGMPLAKAVEALKQNGQGMQVEVFDIQFREPKLSFPVYIGGIRYSTRPGGNAGDAEEDLVVVWLSGPPSEPSVIAIGRLLQLAPDNEVRLVDMASRVVSKYGRPHKDLVPGSGPYCTGACGWAFNRTAPPPGRYATTSCWVWDPHGSDILSAMQGINGRYTAKTGLYGNLLQSGGALDDPADPRFAPDCGQTMWVQINRGRSNPELSKGLIVLLRDHVSSGMAMRATRDHLNGLMSGAQQREAERAKQRKGPAM